MLGCGVFHLVFHLKHDGDVFRTVRIEIAKDKIPLAAVASIIVLLKLGQWETESSNFVELSLAMLLQRFAYHLGRKASFHLFVMGDLLVLDLKESITISYKLGLFAGVLAFHCSKLPL